MLKWRKRKCGQSTDATQFPDHLRRQVLGIGEWLALNEGRQTYVRATLTVGEFEQVSGQRSDWRRRGNSVSRELLHRDVLRLKLGVAEPGVCVLQEVATSSGREAEVPVLLAAELLHLADDVVQPGRELDRVFDRDVRSGYFEFAGNLSRH